MRAQGGRGRPPGTETETKDACSAKRLMRRSAATKGTPRKIYNDTGLHPLQTPAPSIREYHVELALRDAGGQ